MMSVSIIDETANREKMIDAVAKIIGKSDDSLRFFEIVYNGKTKIKTQQWVMEQGGFPSTKRVLEIGKKFIAAKIVNPVKDESKRIAYEKIDFFAHIKTNVIKKVKKNLNEKETQTSKKNEGIRLDSKKKKGMMLDSKKKTTAIKKWDVFICHASEDKKSVARPLAMKLKKMGLEVWYDEFEIVWGNSLMKSIDKGLKNSQYGIVILSPSFFKKQWPQKELGGLHSLSMAKDKDMILPLLHNLTHEKLTELSPLLSDILYKKWDEGPDNISKEVKKLVNRKKGDKKQ